tara:strand:+ start:876 stop:1919 length:1044 start_codon:yes stop_codon:yes gene_type:complete
MKVAVVGAGIFGSTVAVYLSKVCEVTLYDLSIDIMSAASRTNQLRLHRGYHYPRSPKTVSALLKSINFFTKEYSNAIIDDFQHYYCIAKDKSLVSPEGYLSFCDNFNLEYEIIENFEYVNLDKIALTVKVKESLLDYQKVYSICKERIKSSSIILKLNTRFRKEDCEKYDLIINCTYANINDILDDKIKKDYQFEVCEKIAVEMPKEMKDKSIVVMDGPFMCVDPYGRTGNSLLGNVVHAIHSTNIDKHPLVNEALKDVLNKGIIENPGITRFDEFIRTGREYIPSLNNCKYLGSMYTIRAVLPNMDDTDGRPTVVSVSKNNIINIFSGKIDTCVSAANEILNLVSK